MPWLRETGAGSDRVRFSDRPMRNGLAALLVVLSGGIGAAAGLATQVIVPSAAPMFAFFGFMIAAFAAVHMIVHRFHGVDPITLAKAVYLTLFILFAFFFGVRVVLGLPPIPGQQGGVFWLVAIAIALLVPLLPLFPIALAIGDTPPPVDESRLDEPPHL